MPKRWVNFNTPLKCDYCGKFIAGKSFDDGTAYHRIVEQKLDCRGGVDEIFVTYHVSCQVKNDDRLNASLPSHAT